MGGKRNRGRNNYIFHSKKSIVGGDNDEQNSYN